MRKSLGFGHLKVLWVGLFVLFCALPVSTRCQQLTGVPNERGGEPATPRQPDQEQTGMIRGKVVDQSGSFITGASVKLTLEGQSQSLEVTSDEEGQFLFVNVAPGPFQLTIMSEELAPQTISGTLHPAESYVVPQVTMMLVVATQVTVVREDLNPIELANAQIKEQEKQRVLGIIPNFYVSYTANPAPLSPKQKFELAWKSASDPITLAGVGVLAGVGQAADRWGAYGQGTQGYAKRYGATYADIFSATFLAGAVLPSVLKQDPRYFYKGKGSKRSRILYALGSILVCKGDNGRWQPNYSAIVGDLAAGELSNLYYPRNDRGGVGMVFSSAAIRLAEVGLSNILQELVFPRLTPNRPSRAAQP